MRSVIFVLVCALCTVACSAQKPQPVSTTSSPLNVTEGLKAKDLVGDNWFGDSKCTGNNPSCHYDVVRYRFSEIAGDTNKVHLAADKQVNGEWGLMGEFDFAIDAAKNTITAEFTIPRTGGKGVWSFTVTGDKIEGTLTVYPENEVGRRVHVERKK
jgi:hypothetical protein